MHWYATGTLMILASLAAQANSSPMPENTAPDHSQNIINDLQDAWSETGALASEKVHNGAEHVQSGYDATDNWVGDKKDDFKDSFGNSIASIDTAGSIIKNETAAWTEEKKRATKDNLHNATTSVANGFHIMGSWADDKKEAFKGSFGNSISAIGAAGSTVKNETVAWGGAVVDYTKEGLQTTTTPIAHGFHRVGDWASEKKEGIKDGFYEVTQPFQGSIVAIDHAGSVVKNETSIVAEEKVNSLKDKWNGMY